MIESFRNFLRCLKNSSRYNALDQYFMSAPHPQNTLDIFKGEWASEIPGIHGDLKSGSIQLFNDPRIEWYMEQLGGIQGKTVLELGPLEAGHTYMLERQGAESILSIEANSRSYLKCLIVKDLLGLKNTKFLLGNFTEYLRDTDQKFDIVLASGVLYHMTNPIELLALIASVTDRLCLWTHYYDHDIISESPGLSRLYSKGGPAEYKGFHHTIYYREYDKKSLGAGGFCGGGNHFSYWLSRDDIINGLKHFGLNEINIGVDDPGVQEGPGISLIAMRK